MADENPQLASLQEFVKAEQRVCPMPVRWTQLWEMLPGRQMRGGIWAPPPPLIRGEWWSSPSFAKMDRLAEHIGYAAANGVLDEIDRFLRGLPESEWAHVAEFLTPPGA